MRATKIFTQANIMLVKSMADQGLGAAWIASTIGSTPGSVRVMCSKMKIKLGRTRGVTPWITCKVSEASFLELNRYARQRKVRLQTLVARLVETIAKDNLFDAVLDEIAFKPMALQLEKSE
jgi:hypothetical protein